MASGDGDDESSLLELTKNDNNLLDSSLDDINGGGTEAAQLDSSSSHVQLAINVPAAELLTHIENDGGAEEDNDKQNTIPSTVLLYPATKAMGILEVLEIVVKHLPFRKLLKLRLLSKTWNDAIIPKIRQFHSPILFSDMKKLYKFLNMNLQSYKIIFEKYDAARISFMSKGMAGLFSICGHFITGLEITIPKNHTKHFLPAIARLVNLDQLRLNEQNPDFPTYVDIDDKNVENPCSNLKVFNYESNNRPICLSNLERITIACSSRAIEKEIEECIIELLAATTTNLQHLEYWNTDDWNAVVFEQFNFNKSILCKFTLLRMQGLTKSHLEFLMDLTKNHGMALKEFTVQYFPVNVVDGQNYIVQLEKFLSLQSNSLKSLSFYDATECISVKLPIMIGLTRLVLGLWRNSGFIFDSFINNFPMLKELRLVYHSHGHILHNEHRSQVSSRDVWISHMKEFVTHPNLQVLEMDEYGIKSTQQMEELATLFPNLIYLDIKLKSLQLMSVIWAKFSRLQILEIKHEKDKDGEQEDEVQSKSSKKSSSSTTKNVVSDSSTSTVTTTTITTKIVTWTTTVTKHHPIIDELITGIPKEVHDSLKLTLNNEPIQDILRTSKTKPGITDLKELLRFKINSKSCSMTDISGYFGFGFPGTKLKSLQIVNKHPNEISLECCEAIWKNMGENSKIHIATKDNLSPDSRDYWDKTYFTTRPRPPAHQ